MNANAFSYLPGSYRKRVNYTVKFNYSTVTASRERGICGSFALACCSLLMRASRSSIARRSETINAHKRRSFSLFSRSEMNSRHVDSAFQRPLFSLASRCALATSRQLSSCHARCFRVIFKPRMERGSERVNGYRRVRSDHRAVRARTRGGLTIGSSGFLIPSLFPARPAGISRGRKRKRIAVGRLW